MSVMNVPQINTRKLLYLAPIAGLVAATLNVLLFQVGTATGAIPGDVIIPQAGQPLSVIPVITSSVMPALLGGVLLALLNRFTKQPLRIFTIITLILFALAIAPPLGIPGAPTSMMLLLEAMHVVVVAVVLFVFNRYARFRNRPARAGGL